jgi:nitrate reductase delta subunit
MFRRLGPEKDTLEDITRIEGLVRDRFRIGGSDIILVSQDPGTKPGCPPYETNVIFWKDEQRYRLKIFAPVSQVTDTDLPVDWLLPLLEDNGDSGCC